MIKSISIENFKGIGDEVTIDLKPITLLFGGNSAGKSTVLQALQYFYEVLDNQNLNADRTQKGGSFIDLGGFQNFVHQREFDKKVKIRIGCAGLGGDFFLEFFEAISEFLEVDRFNGATLDCFAHFIECEVELSIGWSQQLKRAFVSEYRLLVGNDQLLGIVSEPASHRTLLSFNTEHSILMTPQKWEGEKQSESDETAADVYDDPTISCLALCLEELEQHCTTDGAGNFHVNTQRDALPSRFNGISFIENSDALESEVFPDDRAAKKFIREVGAAVNALIVLPLEKIHGDLDALKYLGPLRDPPARGFKPPRHPSKDRWATGLAAWDALANDSRGHFADEVNEWLASPERLACGYSVENRTSFIVDAASSTGQWLASGTGDIEEWAPEISAALVRRSRLILVPANDQDIELHPSDVGTGISQLIPVVVAACHGDEQRKSDYRQKPGCLITVEQPELHVHPRIQAELGDLFIEAWQRKQNQFILETHSEHLILRLLRRIRETDQGTLEPQQQLRTDELAIYYLSQENGSTTVRQIDVDVKGDFIQPWPDDFFEIDFNERFGIDKSQGGEVSE